LLDAAGELLAINPTASLADIAAHAGIGKATLHRYFASRDDLIRALAMRSLMLVEAAIIVARLDEGSFTDAFRRLVEGLIPLADKFYFLLHVLDYLLYATWHAVYKGEIAKNDAPALVMTTLLQGFAARR
jgi:AcrR family transcriptional regulator